MQTEEVHKAYIEKEYKRLFSVSAQDKEPEKSFYHLVMIGSEGIEGFLVAEKMEDLNPSAITTMQLRARYNSQRNIECFAFKSPKKFEMDDININVLQDHGAVTF